MSEEKDRAELWEWLSRRSLEHDQAAAWLQRNPYGLYMAASINRCYQIDTMMGARRPEAKLRILAPTVSVAGMECSEFRFDPDIGMSFRDMLAFANFARATEHLPAPDGD